MSRSHRPVPLVATLAAAALAVSLATADPASARLVTQSPPPPTAQKGPAAPKAAAGPSIAGVFPLDAQPNQIARGTGGLMWVSLSGSNDELATVQPDGTITTYDLDPITNLGGLTLGPDGNMWASLTTGVVKIPPADPTSATAYDITGFSDNRGIVAGAKGSGVLWATNGDSVFKIPIADPTSAQQFELAGMGSREITRTPNGRIWVSDNAGGRIVAVAEDGTFTEHDVDGNPQAIVAGPGEQVLYTNPGTDPQTIGRLKLGGQPQLTNVALSDPSFSAAYARDGNYWVGLFNNREVLRITPQGAVKRFGPFPEVDGVDYRPRYLATGADGTVWVSLQDPGNDGAIGRIRGIPGDTSVTVKVASKRIVVGADRRGKVRLTCPAGERSGPCSGKVSLAKASGPRSFKVAAGRTRAVSIRITPRALRRLARSGGAMKVTLVAQVRDRAGNKATVRRTVTLKRR